MKAKAILCQTCSKFDEAINEKELIHICGRCPDMKKKDMAKLLRDVVKVYINENNVGRKPKSLNATQRNDIYYKAQCGEKIGDLAKDYKISVTTARKYTKKLYN